MADKRQHRGPHPEDREFFDVKMRPRLADAVAHLSWLLTHGYAGKSSIKLVGDRFALADRQRVAVMRCACSDEAMRARHKSEVDENEIGGESLMLDGYNVLTTIEAALSGGVVLVGRDGCCRDMASMHGHYKKVHETIPAIRLIGETLAPLQPSEVVWFLDRPVSNSGRLHKMLLGSAAENNWNWRVEMVQNPDPVLIALPDIIVTADSMILDGCARWFNLARKVIHERVAQAWIVELAGNP